MKILVVEDSRIALRLLEELLRKAHHEVVTAVDGAEAWRIFQEQHFDAIISDWMMPNMDGLTLCRNVRGAAERPYCYFILLTSRDQREDKQAGMEAGADDFLVKPPDPTDLMARLGVAQRILDMQEKLRAQSAQMRELMDYLELTNKRFAELYMGLPVACVTCDLEGRIQEWNRASEQLFGIRAQQAVQHFLWETLYPAEKEWEVRDKLRALQKGEGVGLEEEWCYAHPDSNPRHLVCYAIPLKGHNDAVVGAIVAHVDITSRVLLERELSEQLALSQRLNAELDRQRRDLARANQKLEELATVDPLTGLANRRLFWERINEYFAQATRTKLPLSLLLFDVDHFKGYNDSYGHSAGDDLLHILGELLRSLGRTEDIVARYGGEEFAMVLPATDAAGAKTVAERLRALVENYRWPLRAVTISVGIATYNTTQPFQNVQQLIDAADVALYKAKQEGRNRVVVFDPKKHRFEGKEGQAA